MTSGCPNGTAISTGWNPNQLTLQPQNKSPDIFISVYYSIAAFSFFFYFLFFLSSSQPLSWDKNNPWLHQPSSGIWSFAQLYIPSNTMAFIFSFLYVFHCHHALWSPYYIIILLTHFPVSTCPSKLFPSYIHQPFPWLAKWNVIW